MKKMQIQIQEILKAHPELKIRESLELYENKADQLFAATETGFLQIIAKDGDIQVQAVKERPSDLRLLQNSAMMRGD